MKPSTLKNHVRNGKVISALPSTLHPDIKFLVNQSRKSRNHLLNATRCKFPATRDFTPDPMHQSWPRPLRNKFRIRRILKAIAARKHRRHKFQLPLRALIYNRKRDGRPSQFQRDIRNTGDGQKSRHNIIGKRGAARMHY